MKKFIALFLIVAMCFSFAACGSEKRIRVDEFGNVYFPTEKSFREHTRKVEITKYNWKEYFEDYENVEHIVEKNDFGDIENEYDEIIFEFRSKKGIPVLLDSASFKFDGHTSLIYTSDGPGDINHLEIHKYKVKQPTYKVYDFKTKNFVEEYEVSKSDIKDYYLVELDGFNDATILSHYAEHNCIDAIGTIYVFDLPEGAYNGQDLSGHVIVDTYGSFQIGEFDKFLEE